MKRARRDQRISAIRTPRSARPVRFERGYVLLPVVLGITLIALISFMLSGESATDTREAGDRLERVQAEHLAQSGLEHAIWRAHQGACLGDFTIPVTSLGADRYEASTTGGSTGTAYRLPADQDAWIRNDNPSSNNGSSATHHVRFENGDTEQVLFRFDLSSLPANAEIRSATAFFHLVSGKPHPEGPITVHAIQADWGESTVTWESFGGEFASERLAMIPAQATGDVWVQVNLTGQVQAWVNGQPNFGVLFDSQAEGIHTEYTPREDGSNPPRLEVVVGTGPASPLEIKATGTLANGNTRTLRRPGTRALQPSSTLTLQPGPTEGKDAYIWESHKATNYGSDDETWVARGTNNTALALFEFNMGAVPTGAEILNATLSLHHRSGNGSDVPVTAHQISNSWNEDFVTWNGRNNGRAWDSPGGDVDTSVIATTDVGPASNTRYEWDLTRLVQGWTDGRYVNHGVALATALNGAFGERFDTSDHVDPTRRPRLSIRYACECGRACMAPQGSGDVLMVIGGSPADPSADDEAIQKELESWGYVVTLIQDDDSQGNFDAAAGGHDVVLVSESASSLNVGSKLTNAAIGVVSIEGLLNPDLGIAADNANPVGSSVEIVDTSHYITQPFPAGALEIYSADMEGLTVSGTEASGLQTLADWGGVGSLVLLDEGAELGGDVAGTNAAGRRVMLPLGRSTNSNFSWVHLNASGRLLVQRAIQWGAGREAVAATASLLMVVVDPGNLTIQEAAKKALIESWGYSVDLVDENDGQASFDAAVAANEVVFISEDVDAARVGTKLVNATIGVVTEEANLSDEFGMGSAVIWSSGTSLNIKDPPHYITEPFGNGDLTILTASQSLAYLDPDLAPDLLNLGSVDLGPGLVALEVDAALGSWMGGNAAGRRVQLPWGGSAMDVNLLNADGLTLFERALEWGRSAYLLGPTAHWKLDETAGTTAVDSEGGHDGTLTLGPVWAPGQHDGALDFDGANDHLVVPHDSSLSLSSAMTFSAWVNASSYGTSYQTILAKDAGGAGSNYWFGTWSQELAFGFFSGGVFREVLTSGLGLQPDTWYHLAASFDNGTGEVRLYVDGVEVHTDTLAFSPTSVTADLTIGRSSDGEYWRGLLDDVRIYDRALDGAEVDELAIPGASPVAENVLLVVGNAGSPATTDVDRMKLITDWGYTVTLFDDGESQAAFDAAVAANDVVFVTGSIGGGTLAHKLTGAPGPIVNEFPGKLDNFGFSQGTGLAALASSFSASDPSHYISSPFGGSAIIALTSAMAMSIPSGTLAPGLQVVAEVSTQPGLVALGAGAQRWDGGLVPARRVHLPLGAATLDQLTPDGRELMKRAIEWAGGAIGGGGGGGGGIDPDPCAGTLADDFQTDDYTGSTGSLSWAGPWLEINESDGPNSGDEQIVSWGGGGLAARVADNDGNGEGLGREADLSGYIKAELSFRYWRVGLDSGNDYVRVDVSNNGGGSWSEIARFAGAANDAEGSPQLFSYDLSSFISPNTRIRLQTSRRMGPDDIVYFDDVQIGLSGCAN